MWGWKGGGGWGSVGGKRRRDFSSPFSFLLQEGETTSLSARPILLTTHYASLFVFSFSLSLSFHQAPLRTIAPFFPASRPACHGGLPAATTVVCAAAATEATPEEAVAFLRYSRGSAQKVRRVLDQIRGRSYEEALMMLEYMPYQACEPVIKTLLSAAANAKNNLGMKKKDLYVSECFADEGPVMKRFRPRAQGRANRILKPTVHITVKVAEREA